ncbi:MAG: hypothetical protein ACKVS6_00620 [Planctomycetota bacterium]
MQRYRSAITTLILSISFAACAARQTAAPVPGRSVYYSFEGFESGEAPKSIETATAGPAVADAGATPDARPIALGINDTARPGRWLVLSTSSAKRGKRVLLQKDATDTKGRVPIAWVRDADFRGKVAISVDARSHEMDGLVDVGLAWNIRNANEYLVLHADGDRHELRAELVTMARGSGIQPAAGRNVKILASAPYHFSPNKWFNLSIEQDSGRVRCGVNSEVLLNFTVPAGFESGSVGLCTFEGVTAEFDEFIAVGDETRR